MGEKRKVTMYFQFQ